MGIRKNQVRLDGHLGKTPELKELDGGSKVIKLSLATKESHKDDSGKWKTDTDWHRCVAWGRNAERIAEKCVKGDRVIVEGKLKTRNWKDGEHNRSTTEVIILSWDKVSKTTTSKSESPYEHEVDDLPF